MRKGWLGFKRYEEEFTEGEERRGEGYYEYSFSPLGWKIEGLLGVRDKWSAEKGTELGKVLDWL